MGQVASSLDTYRSNYNQYLDAIQKHLNTLVLNVQPISNTEDDSEDNIAECISYLQEEWLSLTDEQYTDLNQHGNLEPIRYRIERIAESLNATWSVVSNAHHWELKFENENKTVTVFGPKFDFSAYTEAQIEILEDMVRPFFKLNWFIAQKNPAEVSQPATGLSCATCPSGPTGSDGETGVSEESDSELVSDSEESSE